MNMYHHPFYRAKLQCVQPHRNTPKQRYIIYFITREPIRSLGGVCQQDRFSTVT